MAINHARRSREVHYNLKMLARKFASWCLSSLLLSFLPLVVLTPSAHAEVVTAPSTFNASTETFTAVSASGTTPSISGFSGTVQVTITSSGGNIKISTVTGLSEPTGYNSRDWNTYETATEISFTGSQADVSNAVSSLMFKASSKGTSPSINVEAFLAGKAFDATTGHYYETATLTAPSTFQRARCLAKYSNGTHNGTDTSTVSNDGCTSTDGQPLQRRTYNGLRGYLANITSLDEHKFLMSKTRATAWIGGSDLEAEGTFVWLDGPESGTAFWSSASLTRRGSQIIASVPGASQYTYGSSVFNYFSNLEPNNASDEDFVEFGFGTDGEGSSWNDCRNGCNRTQYIIEYGDSGDVKSSASATISVRTAPGAPTGVSASVSGNRAQISFTAPTSNGGAAISRYTATSSPGGLTGSIEQSGSGTISITGLISGTAYTFTVTATNAVGTSDSSSGSSSTITNYSAQTISFDDTYDEALPNSSLTIFARSSIGSTVTYRSETPEVCTISANKVITKASGTCRIVASSGETIQSGVTYLAASSSMSFVLRSANYVLPRDISTFSPTITSLKETLIIKPGIYVMSRMPNVSIAPKYVSFTVYVSGKAERTLVYSEGITFASWQTPWHANTQVKITSLLDVNLALEPGWQGKQIYVEEFVYNENSVAGMRSATIRT